MFCAGGRCCRLRSLSATQLSHRELQYNSAHAPHHGEFSCCLGSSARGGEGMVSQTKRCSQSCFVPSASSQGKHAAGMASWLQPGQFWDGEKRTKLPRVLLPQCMLAPSLFLHLGLEFSLVTGFIVSVSDSVRFYGKNLLGTGLRSPWAPPREVLSLWPVPHFHWSHSYSCFDAMLDTKLLRGLLEGILYLTGQILQLLRQARFKSSGRGCQPC